MIPGVPQLVYIVTDSIGNMGKLHYLSGGYCAEYAVGFLRREGPVLER